MKKYLLLSLALILVLSGCGKEIKNKDENENLSRQEKCEKSGGKWDSVICNHPGCKPSYYCNCLIERRKTEENELFKRDSKFLIKKDNICISCKQDSDCGKNICEDNYGCRQYSASCKEGFCYTKSYVYSSDGPSISYSCMNNECQIKGDNLGYIKYLHTNSYYSQGEDIVAAVKIKNISSVSHNFKITFEIKKEYSDVVATSKSLAHVIDPNTESEIKVEIPAFDIELEKGYEGFDLSVTVSDAGTVNGRIIIRQKQQITIESLDISGKLSKSENYPYAIFKVNIKNPTNESFRAFVDLYVYKDDGRTLITKRPQMFVDLNPNETKEITDHWSIDELESGFYSLQTVAYVENYKISSDATSFEITP